MLKKCSPLWLEAHFQVKMYKTPHVRATFGGSDVEKVHAIVARSTCRSQNVKNTYFCITKSFTTQVTQAPIHLNDTDEVKNLKQGWNCYEAANNGEPFEGLRIPLGALVCTTSLQVMPTSLHSSHALCQEFLWGGDWTPVSNTEKST